MTTTPHPADALPLPEPARLEETCVGARIFIYGVEVPNFPIGTMHDEKRQRFVDAINKAAINARREGYELAMSTRADLLAEAHAQIRHLIDDLTTAVDDDGLTRYVPPAANSLVYSNMIGALIPLATRMAEALASQPAQEQPISKAQEGREPVEHVPREWRNALRKLAFMAQTSGGTSGPDKGLIDAIAEATALLEQPYLYTTPHPTDALPLPDLSEERINNIADLTVKGMPDGIRGFCVTWGWQQFARALLENFDNTIRAARREGYELAMRKVQEGREPVARVELMTTGGNAGIATRIVEIDDPLRERLRPGTKLYTSPPPTAEGREPVAWRTFDGEGGYEYRSYEDNEDYADVWMKRNPRHKGWVEPLYTSPPPKSDEARDAEREPEGLQEFADRDAFENQNKCSHGFKRSARGTYVNPPVARDWKWFKLGAEHARKEQS